MTLFNRGKSNPDLFPEVETILGDRETDVKRLQQADRHWDTGIDVAGYLPRIVRLSAEVLKSNTYGERALIIRPGLIVGPHDPTDRFTYWPVRVARGGEVLAPQQPEAPIQIIDVGDLSNFIVKLIEENASEFTMRLVPIMS